MSEPEIDDTTAALLASVERPLAFRAVLLGARPLRPESSQRVRSTSWVRAIGDLAVESAPSITYR